MATTQIWTISLVAVLIVLALDLIWAVLHRHKETTLREAAAWTFLYVSAAVIFGFSLQSWGSDQVSKEFFAGWITEYSLSVDNLFVFVIIDSPVRYFLKSVQLI